MTQRQFTSFSLKHNKTIRFVAFFCVVLFFMVSHIAHAQDEEKPLHLNDLRYLEYDGDTKGALYGVEGDDDLEFERLDIRKDALREAAMSLGARAGLSHRTWEIRKTLERQESYLDRVYDFRRLLIQASSGLMIEPPIVSEAQDAMIIEDGGQTAAVTDRIININKRAQIVSAPRNWRNYLERDWGKVHMPPSVLLPKDDDEKKVWQKLVREGWEEGIRQANEIFEADLNRLNSDFAGMIRYRTLLQQGIITPPFALEMDRGITGGGSEMRVGDRALAITGQSELKPDALTWKPADR
jgi:defect-in-organelle-trafficking protein DotC